MTWVTQTKRHWSVIHACGHIVKCACTGGKPPRSQHYSSDPCPDCAKKAS